MKELKDQIRDVLAEVGNKPMINYVAQKLGYLGPEKTHEEREVFLATFTEVTAEIGEAVRKGQPTPPQG